MNRLLRCGIDTDTTAPHPSILVARLRLASSYQPYIIPTTSQQRKSQAHSRYDPQLRAQASNWGTTVYPFRDCRVCKNHTIIASPSLLVWVVLKIASLHATIPLVLLAKEDVPDMRERSRMFIARLQAK